MKNIRSTGPFYAVSFLSGTAALIYQITWIKRFSHLFGLQILTVSVVLGTFMTGLALGSMIIGRMSDRKNPVMLFVILESGLALFAFLFPLLFQAFSGLYTFLGGLCQQSLTILHLLRFILSFLFLLIPATCIGGTLPVLVRIVTLQIGSLGRNLGVIYGIYNLGALTGCLLTGFFLVQSVGISGSLITGGLLNLFNAAFILLLVRVFAGKPILEIVQQEKATGSMLKPLPRNILILIMIVFTVEGFTTLSYEVLWTRVFAEFSYDKTVYLYSVIIAAFIAGLSLGSFLISKYIGRMNDLVAFIGYLEAAIGLLSFIQLILAILFIPVLIEKRELYSSWVTVSGREYLIIFIFIQIPVILMGMTLPVIGRLYARNMENLGGKIGILGMLDTVGSIAGSFIAGFIMLPLLGTVRSVIVTALVNIIMGILILSFHPEKKIVFRKTLVPIIVIATLLLVILRPADPYFKTKFGKKPGQEIVYYDEAACGTVTIHRYPLGYTALSINDILFAYNTADDLRSHRMLACMPYFFHPEPENVMVLGFGLGITAGFFTLENIEKITVAEICPPVIRASATYFSYPNHDIFHDERLEIIPEDGRAWLMSSREKFDIITCDAIHPRFGNNLYTREYYELCRQHLTGQGVLCQWIPINWMTESEYKSLLKTFQSVFPDVSLWYVNRGVTLAVGTLGIQKINLQILRDRMESKQIYDDLSEADILGPEMLIARFLMKNDDLAVYCEDGEMNTDDHPFIEYGKVASMAPNPGILQSLKSTSWDSYSILTGWNEIQDDTSGFNMRLDYYRFAIREEIERDIEMLKMEPSYK